jgi:hypothetical protein
MLVDNTLWPPFRQAKAALFAALLDRNQPLTVPVLSFPPSPRHAVQTGTNKLISSLQEIERELDVIEQEVKQVRESISQRRAAAEMSLQPIGALPSDVIREIVLRAIDGPHSRRQILHLSHVSRRWREAVIGVSALFTAADWDKWPVWLVDIWCSRASHHLLKVCLRHSLRSRQGTAPTPSWHALLPRLSMQVSHLKVVVSPYPGMSMNDAARGVLDFQMPSLKHLVVHSASDVPAEFHLQPENVPTLRVLELANLRPSIRTPLTSVTDLLYSALSFHALWNYLPQILSKLPNLQHLELDVVDAADVPGSGHHHIILPSLISLEVRWFSPTYTLPLFDAFSLPSLQSLVLNDQYDHEDYPTLLQSLV